MVNVFHRDFINRTLYLYTINYFKKNCVYSLIVKYVSYYFVQPFYCNHFKFNRPERGIIFL